MPDNGSKTTVRAETYKAVLAAIVVIVLAFGAVYAGAVLSDFVLGDPHYGMFAGCVVVLTVLVELLLYLEEEK